MLYHGSPVLLEIGDELKTGDELGVSNNGVNLITFTPQVTLATACLI